MEHQVVKNNATKQRVRAFSNLMGHQVVKNNESKQWVRAAFRIRLNNCRSRADFNACHVVVVD
jgi:hypothetical protein